MRTRETILRRAIAALALIGLAGAVQARTIEEIKKEGTMRVATEGQFSPFNYFKGSKLSGFEIDLAEAVAAKMGVKIEWKALGFDALLAGLRQDRWDLVIASHGITEERAKAVTFANPHYCSGGMVVSKNPAIRSAKDLEGKTVSVQTGTTYLENVKKLPGIKQVTNFPQDSDARSALLTGRVDAWVTDRFVALNSITANPAAGMRLGDYVFVERIAAAVAKGNQSVVADYNKALAAIMADGSYEKLSRAWFDEDIRCK